MVLFSDGFLICRTAMETKFSSQKNMKCNTKQTTQKLTGEGY